MSTEVSTLVTFRVNVIGDLSEQDAENLAREALANSSVTYSGVSVTISSTRLTHNNPRKRT